MCQSNINLTHYCAIFSSRASVAWSTVATSLNWYFGAVARQMTGHMTIYHSVSIVVLPILVTGVVLLLSPCCNNLTLCIWVLLPWSPFPRQLLWRPQPLLCPRLYPNAWYRPDRQIISSTKKQPNLLGTNPVPNVPATWDPPQGHLNV